MLLFVKDKELAWFENVGKLLLFPELKRGLYDAEKDVLALELLVEATLSFEPWPAMSLELWPAMSFELWPAMSFDLEPAMSFEFAEAPA